MKNWRKMLEAIGGYDNELVGVPSGGVKEMVEEIESLRQQLTEAQTCITEKTSYIDWLNGHCSDGWDKADELSGQLADSQNQVKLLRDAILRTCCNSEGVVCLRGSYDGRTILQEALAATDNHDRS